MTLPLFGAPQEEATSDDYYTPSWVFEQMAIRFDLDVAAPPGGVPWIPADRYLTKADDGLSKHWKSGSRVWMNPPWSQPRLWVPKFIEHGHGVALLPFAKSRWLNELWESEASVGVLESSLEFVAGHREHGRVMLPVCLWAFGDECVEAISRIGHVR